MPVLNHKIDNPRFEPVEDPRADSDDIRCGDCAFTTNPGCMSHACHAEDFPVGHPMNSATHPIIWRAKA